LHVEDRRRAALTAALLMTSAARDGEPVAGVFAAALYPILSEATFFCPACSLLAATTSLAIFVAVSPRLLLARSVLAGLIIGAAGAVEHTAAFEALAALANLVGAQDASGLDVGQWRRAERYGDEATAS
jgi:hypothetical protein